MKLASFLVMMFLLASCKTEKVVEVDLYQYFKGINGTAVFYNPSTSEYKVFNIVLSDKRSSPCSTFKIMAAYIALSEHIVSPEDSMLKWSGMNYEFPAWNKNMDMKTAFKTSCVWYFRRLINNIPPQKVQSYLQEYQYGNQDVSDWAGEQNANTDIKDLKGFWLESSLKISPMEQVRFLARMFARKTSTTDILKDIMQISESPAKIYGKTGLGIKDDKVDNAWFIGFYEREKQQIFFAVRLNDKQNNIQDYRHRASFYARQIAIDIIQNANLF